MNNFENFIRGINWMRLALFIIIGLMAVLQYIQTQSPSAIIESALSILGIIKSFFPGNTAKMPDGEVVSTLKTP